jgi:predicted permease
MLVAGIGLILQRTFKIDPRPLSQTVFNVFTPALVFTLLYSTEISAGDLLRMVLFAAGSMFLIGALSWFLGGILQLSKTRHSAFILAVTFSNAGNFGLSVNKFAFGDQALAWASIFYITSSLLINSVGVYIARSGRSSPLEALKGLLKVPSVYAIPLALIARSSGFSFPTYLWQPLDLLASAAIPSMLIILGIQIGVSNWPRQNGLLALTLILRLLVSPAIAFALTPLLGFQGPSFQAGILEAAMPTAVMTSILALEFEVQPDYVSNAILATTVLSPLTVTPLIALLSG